MNLFSKTWPSFGSASLSFAGGTLSGSLSGPSGLSVSASCGVADLAIDGLEKVIPGVFAKAVLEEGRAALKAVT